MYIAMHKGFRYRLYPDSGQLTFFRKNIGCCRFVYNQALGWRKAAYDADKTSLSYKDTAYGVTRIKSMYPWLKEADSAALQQSLKHLDAAYKNYFKSGSGFPKFKSKHRDVCSYTTPMNGNSIKVGDRYVTLPKVGAVKMRNHRPLPPDCKIESATITIEKDGSCYISICCTYCIDTPDISPSVSISHIGLDYKSDGLYVDSNGDCADMPHYYRDAEKRLYKAQRKLSHIIGSHVTDYKVVGDKRYPIYDKLLSECKNIQKQRARVARISRHVANQRKDFLHKRSAEITNRYDLISVEDLNMKAMSIAGFGNGKATLDNGYGMFLSMLEYKQLEKGHFLVKVDKWYPSSQLCSCCGHKNPVVKDLSVREWVCPVCGTHHNRDINASTNIDNEGLRILLSS